MRGQTQEKGPHKEAYEIKPYLPFFNDLKESPLYSVWHKIYLENRFNIMQLAMRLLYFYSDAVPTVSSVWCALD